MEINYSTSEVIIRANSLCPKCGHESYYNYVGIHECTNYDCINYNDAVLTMQEYDIDESNFDNLVLHESVQSYEYNKEELLISDTKDIESIEENQEDHPEFGDICLVDSTYDFV